MAAEFSDRGIPTVEDYARGIRESDRGILARAITLIESRRSADMALAQELQLRLQPEIGATPFALASPVSQESARAPSSTPWAPN